MNTDRWSTAYHEAGHAVAHSRLNVLQGNVTIKHHGDNLGSSTAEGKDHVWNIEDARKQLLCYCAGYAALIAAGRDEAIAMQGCDDDMENASDILEIWLPSDSLDDWKKQSIDLLSTPENIRAVEYVTKALLEHETLDGDYAEMLIELADGNITDEEWRQFLTFQFPNMLTQESE